MSEGVSDKWAYIMVATVASGCGIVATIKPNSPGPFLGGSLEEQAPLAHSSLQELWIRGVESKLQLPAYTTATATRDPSRVCH